MHIILAPLHLIIQVYGCILLILYICTTDKRTRPKKRLSRSDYEIAGAGRPATPKTKKKKSSKRVQQQSQVLPNALSKKVIVEKKEEPKIPLEHPESTNPLRKIQDPELDKDNAMAAYYTDEGQDDTNQDAPSIGEILGPPSDDMKPPDQVQTAIAKVDEQQKTPVSSLLSQKTISCYN
ncbi:hypothetical protein GCK32_011897 [Trichostrongylus colubriformis]|uniref:Uncharacterized protein n=1 Tax=Trichostrongylus colubriformis TaxID=6319 RepID=A0AAN8G504_TRICO